MYPRLPVALLFVVVFRAATGLSAAPLVSLGSNADLFFLGNASFRYSSNVFLDDPAFNSEVDDVVYIFSPGLEFVLGGQETVGRLRILFREDFLRYSDNGRLDSEDALVNVRGGYDDDKLMVDGSFQFVQADQNTADANRAGTLIQRDTSSFNLVAEYTLSLKTSASVGFTYNDLNFTSGSDLLTDRTTITIPVNLYYGFSPKIAASVGYQFRDTALHGGNDRTDHFFNVGLRGELAPKLDADMRIGFQSRDIDVTGVGSETFAVNSRFSWYPGSKTQIVASLNRDFSSGGTGDSIEDTGISVFVTQAISPLLSGNVNVSFSNADYQNTSGRADDTFNFGISVSYFPNDFISVRAGYSYEQNDSNAPGSNFENSSFNVSASLRY